MSSIDRYHNADKILRDRISHVKYLAQTFNRLGNDKISGELCDISNDLEAARRAISDYVMEQIDGRLRDARQHTAGLLQVSVALLDRSTKP